MEDNYDDVDNYTEFSSITKPVFSVIHIPPFIAAYEEYVAIPTPLFKETLQDEDWTTQVLLEEIQMFLPQRGDISKGGNNTRDPKAFAFTAQRLFPVGRIFSSHKQLDRTDRMFGSHWAVQLTHSGTIIGCHYGC